MAERRMLHRKVSVSADLAALDAKHGPRAVLFYTWLIPQLDRWGCAPAEPATLLGMVGPLWRDVEPKDVARWLAWMIRRGVLEAVEGRNGERGVRVPRFHEHQVGSHWEREKPSIYEPSDVTKRWKRSKRKGADMQDGPGPVRDQSGPGPSEVKGREVNPSPSLPPTSPIPQDSAAPAASALAGPKPPAPEVEDNGSGNGRVDLDAIAADAPPAIAAAIKRARARVLTEEA